MSICDPKARLDIFNQGRASVLKLLSHEDRLRLWTSDLFLSFFKSSAPIRSSRATAAQQCGRCSEYLAHSDCLSPHMCSRATKITIPHVFRTEPAHRLTETRGSTSRCRRCSKFLRKEGDHLCCSPLWGCHLYDPSTLESAFPSSSRALTELQSDLMELRSSSGPVISVFLAPVVDQEERRRPTEAQGQASAWPLLFSLAFIGRCSIVPSEMGMYALDNLSHEGLDVSFDKLWTVMTTGPLGNRMNSAYTRQFLTIYTGIR